MGKNEWSELVYYSVIYISRERSWIMGELCIIRHNRPAPVSCSLVTPLVIHKVYNLLITHKKMIYTIKPKQERKNIITSASAY
jgi:hypothetical protein